MPTYKLTYFDLRGRGEIARLLFALAGVPFEDNRINQEGWPAVKPSTPFGQLPVLEVDGVKIAQSVAIANYLAREFGLYGKTNKDGAVIDQILCLIQDYFAASIKVLSEPDEAKKAELSKVHNEETKPRYLGYFENLLKQNGSGFFVGGQATVADLFVYDLVTLILQHTPHALDNNKDLKAHFDRVGSIPQIKAYVAARKHTEW